MLWIGRYSRRSVLLIPVFLVFPLTGCSDDGDPTSPEGSMVVTTTTSGEVALAGDGYTVTVEGEGDAIVTPNGSVSFTSLAAGDYQVTLSDVAADCVVSGSNPRTVTVTSGAAAATTFVVACEATVFLEGDLVIRQTFSFDVDAGVETGLTDPGTDVWFEAVTADERFFSPQNDALIAFAGMTAPGKGGCLEADLAEDQIDVTTLTLGTFVCVQTNEGRISELEITDPSEVSAESIEFHFTTYE